MLKDELLDLVHDQVSQLMDASDMYVALLDEATDAIQLELVFVDGKRIDTSEEEHQLGQQERDKIEAIIHTREPIYHLTKVEAETWFIQHGYEKHLPLSSASWLGVPIATGGKVIGVIVVYHPTQENNYTKKDQEVLESIASLTAVALENAQLYEETRREMIAAKQLATLGTAMVALQHRINNSLNIIVPNVNRLRKRVDLSDTTVVEILDIIERNARYTAQLIARIQEPLRAVEYQTVNINAVLHDVVARISEEWEPRSGTLVIEVAENLDESVPLIRVPTGQIAEVFRNLIDNAFRAMKDGGKLVVATTFAEDTIYVRIQDTGPGIPTAIHERLFKKPVPSRESAGGAGLGLWLSHLILQSLGGTILVEKSDSDGTTMLVRVPVPRLGANIDSRGGVHEK